MPNKAALRNSDHSYSLWPGGPRWDSAELITETVHRDTNIEVWKVTCANYDFDIINTYHMAVCYPFVWGKPTPSACIGRLVCVNEPFTTSVEYILQEMVRQLDMIAQGKNPIEDADMIIDARDPDPSGN